jgi:hypothetical protein
MSDMARETRDPLPRLRQQGVNFVPLYDGGDVFGWEISRAGALLYVKMSPALDDAVDWAAEHVGEFG